jgi:hypothetical protein
VLLYPNVDVCDGVSTRLLGSAGEGEECEMAMLDHLVAGLKCVGEKGGVDFFAERLESRLGTPSIQQDEEVRRGFVHRDAE